MTRAVSGVSVRYFARSHRVGVRCSKPLVSTILPPLRERNYGIHDRTRGKQDAYPEWMLATQGADRLGPVDLWSRSVNHK